MAILKAQDRLRIARALLGSAPGTSLPDAARVAQRIVDLDASPSDILAMSELACMPDARAWLAAEIGRALGVVKAAA